MEKNDNYSPLVKEYLDGYYLGFYKSLDISYMPPVSTAIDKLDRLGLLPKCDVDYLTSEFNIMELELICNKDAYQFDGEYCRNINSIITKTRNSKKFIEDNTLMEYIKESLNMQYGFEMYISESEEFRSFIYDLSEKYKYKIYDFKKILGITLNYLTAYLYYYNMDKDLIRKLSIIFMCHYEEVADTFSINGFNFRSLEFDNNYFETLISLIQKCSKNEDNGKVIS